MRWGLFQMAEYVNMITLSALAVTLFFGGWEGPWAPLGPLWFFIKLFALRLRLHLAARDAAAPALRPADALRLEGAAPGGDDQRGRHRAPGGGDLVSPQPDRHASRASRVTFRQIFKKPITQQYPEYKRPVYPRFRGRHRLHLHENGLEKCVGCSLCAAACPADCIRVVAAENTPPNRVSAGERYARIYEINMSRCIFCGYCELACPFDAITLGNEFEISEYSRDDLIYTKDMLLARADQAGARSPTRRSSTRRSPTTRRTRDRRLGAATSLVWAVWVVAAFACLGSAVAVISLHEPVLLGARADREPRLARGALPAALGRVRRRRAGARLRRRGDGHVPVRDRLPRRPRRRALGRRADAGRRVGAVAAAGALLVEIVVVIASKAGGRLSKHAEIRPLVRQPGRDRAPLPDRPPARVRDHVDRAARRRGRRRGPRQPCARRRAER